MKEVVTNNCDHCYLYKSTSCLMKDSYNDTDELFLRSIFIQ